MSDKDNDKYGVPIGARVPLDWKTAIARAAKKEDVNVTEWLKRLIARELKLTLPKASK